MKKAILLCSALLAVLATSAFAQGMNLGWGTCATTATTQDMAYDPNGFDGSVDYLLNGTFTAPAGATNVSGMDVVIDLQAAGSTLPGWWDFNAPCRGLSVIAAAFGRPSTGCGTARNYFSAAAGGIAAIRTSTTPNPTPAANRERIVLSYGLADANVAPLTTGQLVYAFGISINGLEGSGASAECGGGATPVDIVLNSMVLGSNQPGVVPDILLTNQAVRQCATWNGGLGGPNCTQATPTRNATWGQLKSLYK